MNQIQQRVKELYNQGLNDFDMADRLCYTLEYIRLVRRSLGLDAHRRGYGGKNRGVYNDLRCPNANIT